MKLTVKKLLSLEAYREAKLVGGSGGLNNEVTGITIMEDITINEWLRGGETLLTGLLPVKDFRDDEIVNFFNLLITNKSISAVIVKVGKAFNEIPQCLIKWGDENSIAVIEVPRHVFYTDLMYPAMAEVMESQVNKLTYFKSVHDQFRDMAIKNYSIKMVIDALSNIIGNPVEIYDKNYNLMTSTLKEKIIVAQNEKINLTKISKGLMYTKKILGNNEEVGQLIFEITALEDTKTYLGIIELNKKVDELDFLAIENACTNISLIMAKDKAIKEVEERFMNDIVNDLIFNTPRLSNPLLERANIAGIDLFGSYYIAVLNLKCKLDCIKYDLKKLLKKLIKEYDGVYSLRNDYVIIFINSRKINDTKESHEEIKNKIKKISEELGMKYSQICFSAGIGSEIKGFENIRKSYNEAVDAIAIGEDIYGKNAVTIYEELGVFKLIRDVSLSNDVSKYIPNSVTKLLQVDSSKNSELLKTLEIYFKTNQHIGATANELFIHPKTVSYRIEQIKELTGIDFDNADQLLEIQFSIKIIRFLEKNKLEEGR